MLHYPHRSPATICYTLAVLDQEGGWAPLSLPHPVPSLRLQFHL